MKILLALSFMLNICLIGYEMFYPKEKEREIHVISKAEEDSIVAKRMVDFMALPPDSQLAIGERLAREYKTRHSK